MTRLETVTRIAKEQGYSALNPDIRCVIEAKATINRLEAELRHAQAHYAILVRGLDHPDYDEQFAGYERAGK